MGARQCQNEQVIPFILTKLQSQQFSSVTPFALHCNLESKRSFWACAGFSDSGNYHFALLFETRSLSNFVKIFILVFYLFLIIINRGFTIVFCRDCCSIPSNNLHPGISCWSPTQVGDPILLSCFEICQGHLSDAEITGLEWSGIYNSLLNA